MEVHGAFQENPLRSRPFSFLRGEQSLSLQMLAATKYALALWRHKYYNPDHDGHPVWVAFPEGLPESCRENIAVAPPIKAIIDDRISSIGEEIKMWEANFRAAVMGTYVLNTWDKTFGRKARFCEQIVKKFRSSQYDLSEHNVLDEKHVDILVKGFDSIVCNLDGTISFQRSVRQFLTKEELLLDVKMRFRIACMFCLENEIMQLWLLVNKSPHVFNQSKLMRYWKSNLVDPAVELSKLLLNFGNCATFTVVLSEVLVDLANNRNWTAFEYLWDAVPEYEYFNGKTSVSKMIIAENDFYSMRLVLLNLNEEQVQNVCSNIGDQIFCTFVTHPKYYEYAMDSWACMKNYISEDMFAKIVHQLWQLAFNPSKSELIRVNHTSSLLMELWTSAADSLKSNVSETDLFAKLDCTVRGVHHYDLKFVFELLDNSSHLLQRALWINNWRKLMIRAKPADLEQLMKLCLWDDDEVEQFKQNIETNIDELNNYFNDCLNKGLYSELSDYLNFFVKNPHRLEELSREMIISNLDRIASCDEDEATQCHLFIRNTFHDAEKADQFIKGMISSPECLDWIYCKLDDCCFDAVANLSRRFPSDDKNFKDTKEEFLVYCHRNFARGQISGFHEQRFAEFVSWSGVGGEKLSELKKSLIIDDIFEIIINEFLQEASKRAQLGSTEQLLTSFDNFLRWYFGSSETAKNYKFVKLTNFHEWEGIMNALRTGDSECVERFLNWGFENDENEVQKVKLRLS
ncbi:uncharacterized protein LOC135844958 isoform X4 [Planococcus citri]|uniref:uncharacterized protein LOC135844958 isoform X4 n=1 Tax=Planococcus citri TaxID=170843 RepID=UPI0031F957E6